MDTLLNHIKTGDTYDEVPFWHDYRGLDISHLDKLVDMAMNYFYVYIKGESFNFRNSTRNNMKKKIVG